MKEDKPPKELCPMCGNEMKYLNTEKFGRSYYCSNKTCINNGMHVVMYVLNSDAHDDNNSWASF